MATVLELMAGDPTWHLFEQVYVPPWRTMLRRLLRRRVCHLTALRTLTAGDTVHSCHCAGVQMVPLAQIRGSESGRHDFDAAFRPCGRHVAERWCRVAEAWQQGVTLPPVELIRVGEVYLVRDGHHRISVARTYGAQEIEALVTVWELDTTAGGAEPSPEAGANRPATAAAPAAAVAASARS